MTERLEIVEAQVRKLAVAAGETLLVCPPAGDEWSAQLGERVLNALQERMPPGAAVLVFSRHIDLAVVEDAPQTPEALAASLTAERFKRRTD